MTNEELTGLGLVVSETGAIKGVDLPISPGVLLAAGYGRRVRLCSLTFDQDLEMTAIFERYIVDEAGNDLFAQIQADQSLHPTAQRERLMMLQPIQIPKTTRGAFRSATTGAVVPDTDPAAISELQFFQSLALVHLQAQGLPLTGSEPYVLVVYLMLANIIREKDALGEF